MGILGLKSFLERSGKTRAVDIVEEINGWKRAHAEQTPIIVVDFCSLTISNKRKEDYICGGADEIESNQWSQIFKNLKEAGCSLVFFSDPKIKATKEKTLDLYNEQYLSYVDLYDRIANGQSLQQISGEWMENFDERTTYRELAVTARKYGEFRYSVNEECDLELAQYASHNNALAVISNDSDFLIYEGAWQLWWTNVDKNLWNQLKTTEYIRKDLERLCSLSRDRLPLFATLSGSHFTVAYQSMFNGYQKFRDVANYIHKMGSGRLSSTDIKRITECVYADAEQSSDEIQRSIRNSLEWFDINVPPPRLDDELAEKFLSIRINGVDMFRPYMRIMEQIHAIPMKYYDYRGCENKTNLPLLLMDWIKRKVGILRQRFHDDNAFQLTIWAKTDIDMTANMIHYEKPIFPDFTVPSLADLYLESGNGPELTDIKWKIVAWIMSLPVDVISALKELPKEDVLISTILCVLVQNGFLSVLEADGIIYTEHMSSDSQTETVNTLETRHVRAAHIYRLAFVNVKENFAIAGLLSHIDRFLNFNGIFYQNVMRKLQHMDNAQRDTFIAPIRKYRIYVPK